MADIYDGKNKTERDRDDPELELHMDKYDFSERGQ